MNGRVEFFGQGVLFVRPRFPMTAYDVRQTDIRHVDRSSHLSLFAAASDNRDLQLSQHVSEYTPHKTACQLDSSGSDTISFVSGQLAGKLAQFRADRNLRQEDVAAAIHVAQSTYARWESGERVPRPPQVQALATFYEVTPIEIDPEKESRQPRKIRIAKARLNGTDAASSPAAYQEALADMLKTDLRLASIVNLYLGMGDAQQKKLSRAASRIADGEEGFPEGDLRATRRRPQP